MNINNLIESFEPAILIKDGFFFVKMVPDWQKWRNAQGDTKQIVGSSTRGLSFSYFKKDLNLSITVDDSLKLIELIIFRFNLISERIFVGTTSTKEIQEKIEKVAKKSIRFQMQNSFYENEKLNLASR